MASPAAAFHVAQEAALRGSVALAAALGQMRLYSTVPTDAPLPYVVIGEDQILLDQSGCAGEGEIFATVNWWSKPNPPQASLARTIGAAVIAALNVALTLTGHDVDEFELQDETYVTDPDGSTHGRAVFHYLTTEQVA